MLVYLIKHHYLKRHVGQLIFIGHKKKELAHLGQVIRTHSTYVCVGVTIHSS